MLIELIVTIAVLGFIVWLITNFIPMDPRFKQLIIVIAIVIVIVILLRAIGVSGGGSLLGGGGRLRL